jgi:hypothetical protein
MEVHLYRSHGYRNDLLMVIPRSGVESAHLHIAHRKRLMNLPGLTRHRKPTDGEREENRQCKIPVERHLKQLGLMDKTGKPLRPVVAVVHRNLGNNHGFVAWQREQKPQWFSIQGDPLNSAAYSCLVAGRDGRLSIQNLHFGGDVADDIAWAMFGQWVLRGGKVVPIEDIIDQFYDVRHVLAFDVSREEGKKVEADIFRDYPDRFRENALDALRQGVPRNRYLHNCIGLSENNIFILQREGTIEEVAHSLRDAGAEDGLILDNGGSVACWAWWVYPNGGYIFAAPDFRPNATSIIAFVLQGPVRTYLPGGSVSYTVV